jgi:hypothetical protein
MAKRKNPHAVALGQRGGLKGGKKGGTNRMAKLDAAGRKALAEQAAKARWGEKKVAVLYDKALVSDELILVPVALAGSTEEGVTGPEVSAAEGRSSTEPAVETDPASESAPHVAG